LAKTHPQDIDDVELMRLASEQDSVAVGMLYDRHSPMLYAVLMQKLADPGEAQDILHDVFMKLHRKASAYNPALGRPVAWLLTMARNAAIDRLRRQTTHRRYVQKAEHEVEGSAPPFSGLHEDEVKVLNDCVGDLPSDQRQTLHLAYFGGLTQQEISDQLSQPLGTVKARIRRGLLKLRDCVEGRS
jgi:RNA polymerase sigma-70 factor, ECF subfamily